MAELVIADKVDLIAVADAIRARTESNDTMSLSEMVVSIGQISGNGSDSGSSDADIPVVGDGSVAVAYANIKLPFISPAGIAPYTITLTCGSNTLTNTYATVDMAYAYALPTTGTWNGSVTDTSGEVDINFSFDVTPFIYSKSVYTGGSRVLADDSWETISTYSKAGNPEMCYNIGDEKDVTLTTGETITLQIIGFNHDVLSDGSGYAGITFAMKNLLATKYNMNSSNTNVGGWESSAMRARLQPNGEIYDTLPDEVKTVIRPVDKITSAGNKSASLVTTSDYAFLLSETEIFGATTSSVTGEGKCYDYYNSYATTSARRIKYLSNGTGSAASWLERSPYASYTTGFCCVASGGSVGGYLGASTGSGVAFGFCV